MEQRISLITLAVADLPRARRFYKRLGWQGQEVEQTVFFQAGGLAVAVQRLFQRVGFPVIHRLKHRRLGLLGLLGAPVAEAKEAHDGS